MNDLIKETKALTMKDSYLPPTPDTKINNYVLDWSVFYYILLAFAAGFIKYTFSSLHTSKSFKLVIGLVHGCVSGLSGYVMLSICNFIELKESLYPAAIAIAGWMGVEFMNWAEKQVIPAIGEKLTNIFKNIFK